MNDCSATNAFTLFGIPEAGCTQRREAMLPDVNIEHPKILIVDGAPTAFKVLRNLLRDAGYDCIVTNAEPLQTLASIHQEAPDVILLDLAAPGEIALDILAAIRSEKEREHLPVIVLSDATQRDTRLRALELGATDFLQTPVDHTELIPRVRNALRIKAFQDYYREFFAAGNRAADEETQIGKEAPICAKQGDGDCENRANDRCLTKLAWPALSRTCLKDVTAQAKVLIVDDEPINIKVVRKYLMTEGYTRVLSTSAATAAIPAVYREAPDLVLLDIMMPGMSGLEILEKLRADEGLAGLPVIILTASTDHATKRRALELGATEFLPKPIDPTELLPRLRNALLVKAYHDQLRGYVRDLERAVAEESQKSQSYTRALEKANAILRRARNAAQSANLAKSQFLANMSHELRTPLTSIIGFAEELLGESQAAGMCARHVSHVETIVRNSTHLLEVINDILDLSKIEAGKLTVEILPCSPATIALECVRSLQAQAARKGLDLSVQCAGPLPETIQTDPTCLRRILLNLLGNALKFTEQGSVRLLLQLLHEPAGPSLEFQVVDTGIGIEKQDLPQLFHPFVQADASVARRYGGTGLGLTISRHLTEKLQGTITVASEPGKGSTFRVRVPTGPLAGIGLLDDPLGSTPSSALAVTGSLEQPHSASLHGRVLLAEDSRDNQRLISLILKRAGIHVELADNGHVAWEKAVAAKTSGTPFDVVLMDMEMPLLDGYAAARQLRESGYEDPIVALTAHAMVGEREKCLAAGCDDYAIKPIDREKLLAMVRHYANRRNQEDEVKVTGASGYVP